MDYRHISIMNIVPRPARRVTRAVLATAAFTLPVAALTVMAQPPASALAAASSTSTGARVVAAGEHTYAPVVDAVAPAVVTIHAEQRVQAAQFASPFENDPLFREFFGNRMPRGEAPPDRRQQGLGSGVIVSPDGYILTNHHVIDGADKITVELTDRRTFTAKVVGSDAPSDLAVLDIEANDLPVVPLADSDAIKVGDVVLAVGNPMGVGQTVTMGIVSAKGRATGLGDGSFEDFLQTDAPINRGNSGGALVNTSGELVGINSQILSPSGGNIGIGFAIPSNMAKQVMESLIADGRVHRGMLGVTIQEVTPGIAKSLGMATATGALVSSVAEDGPADAAGIERGDVITAIEGQTVESSNELRNRIAAMRPGSRVTLTLQRDGAEQRVNATLAELPGSRSASAEGAGEDDGGGPAALGLRVEPLPRERARALGLEEGHGVLVTGVAPNSPASDAGLRAGDVVEEVDGKAVESAAVLKKAASASGERPLLLLVRRDDQSLFVAVSPRDAA